MRRVAKQALKRASNGQGPRPKLKRVRDALYDWFVDIRGSVQGSIGRAFVRVCAQQLASQVIRAMVAKNTTA